MNIFYLPLCLLFSCWIIAPSSIAQEKSSKAQIFYDQAVALKTAGKMEESIRLAEQGARRDRDFAPVFGLLAALYLEQDNARSRMNAVDAIRRALQLEPENAEYKVLHAKIQNSLSFMAGQNAFVAQAYRQALALDSTSADANADLAKVLEGELRFYRHKVGNSGFDESLRMNEGQQMQLGSSSDPDPDRMAAPGPSRNDMLRLYDENIKDYVFQYFSGDSFPRNLSYLVSEAKAEEVAAPDYDKEVRKIEEELIAVSGNALSLDPDNSDAREALWRTLLESEQYEELMRVTEPLISQSPGDPLPLMVTGLAQFHLGNNKDAHILVNRAKALLPPEELQRMESIALLLTPEELERYQAASIEEQKQLADVFWRQHETLLLTDEQERELEHACRFIEADIRFGDPAHDMRGADSDRGRVFLRYGPPQDIKVYTSELPLFTSDALEGDVVNEESLGDTEGSGGNAIVVWYYPQYTFVFQSNGRIRRSNSFSYARSFAGVNFETVVEDIAKKNPEDTQFGRDRDLFDFPWYTATFRGDSGGTRLEVYYGIPLNELSGRLDEQGYKAEVRRGVVLLDGDWRPQYRASEEIRFISGTPLDTSSRELILDQVQLEVAPGEYGLAVEIEDRNSRHTSVYRDSVTIPFYSRDSLMLSDLLIASDIENLPTAKDYLRHGLRVIPHAGRYFRSNELINVYYEIYNLTPSAVPFRSNWELEYSVRRVPSSPNLLKRMGGWFGKLLGKEGEEKVRIAVTSQFEGRSPEEYQYLVIKQQDLNIGEYLLTLTVKDRNSTTSATRQQRFWIGPDEIGLKKFDK